MRVFLVFEFCKSVRLPDDQKFDDELSQPVDMR